MSNPIKPRNYTLRLPVNLTPESAFFALDGPREQRVETLRAIIDKCKNHTPTDETAALIKEADGYLAEQLGAI